MILIGDINNNTHIINNDKLVVGVIAVILVTTLVNMIYIALTLMPIADDGNTATNVGSNNHTTTHRIHPPHPFAPPIKRVAAGEDRRRAPEGVPDAEQEGQGRLDLGSIHRGSGRATHSRTTR